MKMRDLLKKAGLLTAVLVFMFAFTACGDVGSSESGTDSSNVGSGSADEATNGELKTIKIATPGQNAAPVENAALAQSLGYIDEELEAAGYQVEYVGFAQAGPAINEAFAAGEVDYAVYNELPALTAKSNSVDIKIIATVTQDYNYAIIATGDSGIQSAADLKGKKVIVTAGTILYKYFIDVCNANGVDPASVEQINAQADANSVLTSGEADAYVTAYSAALRLQNTGIGNIIIDTTAQADAEERTGIALVARTEVLESEPESAKALIRALNRASEYAAENPDDVYTLLEDENNSVDLLKEIYAYDTSFSYFAPNLSDEYKAKVEAQYNFAKENQLLGGDVDLDELIDSTYLDEVLAE